MISFKPITLADKDLITAFTLADNRRNCDLSFSNLCSWRFLYHTVYGIVDNFLILKFWVENKPVYMMPIGEGDLKSVVIEMIEDAKSEKADFCMLGISSYMKEDLERIMPDRFIYTDDRDYADYIYLRSDLVTLSGKKYQPKRNHINKFKNTYPDWEYAPITPEHISECIALEEKWCRANNCMQQEGTGNERLALHYALKHFDELGLSGGILYVNNQIAAFTFGMAINATNFGVHVEKADTAIEGAYAMINNEFAKHIPEEFIYINREEDLGIEGLRKAKLSYHPVLILEKYMACFKESPMEMIKW